MPSFSTCNHWKNNLFFTISVMLWNMSRMYFLFFNIQNTKSNNYVLTFFSNHLFLMDINEMNIIKDKLTTFHLFQFILISISEWFKKFFYSFICFIINHNFCAITFWMHYRLFIIIYRKIKLFALLNWIFQVSDFF